MTSAAAFYDLDKTIIAKSSTLAFRRPFALAGLIGPTDSLAFGAAQTYYRVAGASHGQLEDSMTRMSDMIRGWPVDKVEALVAGTVEQLIAPYVYVDALKSIREHKEAGRLVVIISSSPREWVEPIGYMIGADRVIATQLGVSGGKYNGDVLFYAYGEQKAVAVRALAEVEGLELAESWAYSDSFTDLPMLEEVGHPVAVNPDADLRAVAEERGWTVEQYVRPPSWDSPLSFVWDAAAALPDVGAAAKIGLQGYVQLLQGSFTASKDALTALVGVVSGSDEERSFFPTVRSRSIRGLQPVTADEVRATFGGAASVSASDVVRMAADSQAHTAAAVQGAVEGVSGAVADAVEAIEVAVDAVISGKDDSEAPAPAAAAPAESTEPTQPAPPASAKPAATRSRPRAATGTSRARSTTPKAATPKTATSKTATSKTATSKTATSKAATSRTAAPKAATPKTATTRASTSRSRAAKPATPPEPADPGSSTPGADASQATTKPAPRRRTARKAAPEAGGDASAATQTDAPSPPAGKADGPQD